MKSLATRIAGMLVALMIAAPASAHSIAPALAHSAQHSWPHSTTKVHQRIEEWDPVAQRWIDIGSPPVRADESPRTIRGHRPDHALARFGPFVVISERVAALVGTTGEESPADFERMIATFPLLEVLSFIDAPGTVDDVANLRLGRRIRISGLSTHIPGNGSARSGAVELFLAGKERIMETGARFAVHSWRDNYGRGPSDFAQDDPVNRLYLTYYVDMGMTETEADAFYAMTNSVPHSSALWFGPDQMRRWIEPNSIRLSGERQRVQIPYVFDRLLEHAVTSGKHALKKAGSSFAGIPSAPLPAAA